jgi:hypothetical protein
LTVGRWTTAGDDPEVGYSPSHHHHHHHLFPEWKRERPWEGCNGWVGGCADSRRHFAR